MCVNDSQFGLLTNLLDLASLRHRTIAQNIANVNTPGFRRLEVQFEESMKQALAGGGLAGTAGLKGKVVPVNDGDIRSDGNNVNVDAEMARLNKNALLYNAFTQIMASKIAAMRSAITGR